jgi:hypothetical protein
LYFLCLFTGHPLHILSVLLLLYSEHLHFYVLSALGLVNRVSETYACLTSLADPRRIISKCIIVGNKTVRLSRVLELLYGQ